MTLATTAITEYWPQSGPIVLLGEWCRPLRNEPYLSGRAVSVVPYHWDDRARFAADWNYGRKIFEAFLVRLTEILNRSHGCHFPERYWRILLSPWLSRFVEVTLDRYRSIETVEQTEKKVTTIVPLAAQEGPAPLDTCESHARQVTDLYILGLYAAILRARGRVEFEERDLSIAAQEPSIFTPRKHQPWQVLLRRSLARMSRTLASLGGRIVFAHSYFTVLEQLYLGARLASCSCFVPPMISSPEVATSSQRRAELCPDEIPADPFVQFLWSRLSLELPRCYLEGFEAMQRTVSNSYPRAPRAIVTATGHEAEEGFRFWAAAAAIRGTKLLIVQHGGHDGVGDISSAEYEAKATADRFFSWGWSDSPAVRALPASKLTHVSRQIRLHPGGGILWGVTTMPRYSYRLYSVPLAGQMLQYQREQEEFATTLPEHIRSEVTLRLYPRNWGWDEAERWRRLGLSRLTVYRGPQTMVQQLNQSRLFICSYNATAHLETMAANFPTLLFWNPALWECRPEAQPYLRELEAAGIFYATPALAAAAVTAIAADVASWWAAPERQAARQRFCERYARCSKRWSEEWAAAIRSEVTE